MVRSATARPLNIDYKELNLRLRKAIESVEVLAGGRGDANSRALTGADLNVLQETVSSLQSAIAAANDAIDELDELAPLPNRVTLLEADVTSLEIQQDLNTPAIAALEIQQDLNTPAIAANGGRLDDLATNGAAVSTFTQTSANAFGATPTASEHDALVADVTAIAAILTALKGALTV